MRGRNRAEQVKLNGELPPIHCANIPGIKWEFDTKNLEIRSISKEGTNSMPFLVGGAQELSLGERQKQTHKWGKVGKFVKKTAKKVKGWALSKFGAESRRRQVHIHRPVLILTLVPC